MKARQVKGFYYDIDRRGRYKYTVARTYRIYSLALLNAPDFSLPYAELAAGYLTARKGYAYDGPSGPTIDTPDAMRGTCFHDIGYQAMRAGLLMWTYRRAVDRMMRHLMLEDGMPRVRATAWYVSVRACGRMFSWWGSVRPRWKAQG